MNTPKPKVKEKMKVVLPARKVWKTPRLLLADAYTVGGDKFQSKEAKDSSVYYITFRRNLNKINSFLYDAGDNRTVFIGLQRILEKLFYEPVTHEEIDETKDFLKDFKITMKGLAEYEFPEHLWRRVVDEFEGRPPIQIKAMPEGSVVYPNEPVIQIRSMVKGFGELAAWFESKLLQVWGASERVTQNEHWLNKLRKMVRSIEPDLPEETNRFLASLMLTDFGDRAGFTLEESEELGMAHLYTFSGTDTCSGAYQAWKNANKTPIGCSVNALAHRNVQAFEFEGDCYTSIYDNAKPYEILSMVADCYDFFFAVENYLLPLALRSVKENNGKVVVARPDSGDPKEQVLFTCRLADQHGLVEYKTINGKVWKFATTLKFIEGDGMTFEAMWDIIEALIAEGFVPYSFGLFGVGGGLRNSLKRDDLSAKYALAAKGVYDDPVIKLSETIAKGTVPGPFKVLRSPKAMAEKATIVFEWEEGDDTMVEYFNGARFEKPFGIGQDDNFLAIRDRLKLFETMPLTLETVENKNYPSSQEIVKARLKLMKKYAPSKV